MRIEDRNIHGGEVFILVIGSIPSSQIHIDTPCEAIGYNSMHQLAKNYTRIILYYSLFTNINIG